MEEDQDGPKLEDMLNEYKEKLLAQRESESSKIE
jgi:hypothetical protein